MTSWPDRRLNHFGATYMESNKKRKWWEMNDSNILTSLEVPIYSRMQLAISADFPKSQ